MPSSRCRPSDYDARTFPNPRAGARQPAASLRRPPSRKTCGRTGKDGDTHLKRRTKATRTVINGVGLATTATTVCSAIMATAHLVVPKQTAPSRRAAGGSGGLVVSSRPPPRPVGRPNRSPAAPLKPPLRHPDVRRGQDVRAVGYRIPPPARRSIPCKEVARC